MKKGRSLLALCLTVAIVMATMLCALPTAAEGNIRGDVNGDGVINVKDTLGLRKYLVDDFPNIDIVAADVNESGAVNVKDAVALKADYVSQINVSDDATAENEEVSIKIGKVSARRNSDVSIPVSFVKNSGIQGLVLTIFYDESALTFAGISSAVSSYYQVTSSPNGKLKIFFYPESGSSTSLSFSTGTIFKLDFHLKGEIGAVYEIGGAVEDPANCINSKCENVPATVTSGQISINEYVYEDFVYYVQNNTAYLFEYTGDDTNIEIPETIDGYPVDIDDGLVSLFDKEENWQNGMLYYGDWLLATNGDLREKAYVKAGTRFVRQRAFAESNVKAVILPESIERIGKKAFFECTRLEEMPIPNGVKRIEESTFEGCERLESIRLPDAVEYVGKNAFFKCPIEYVYIPATIQEIDSTAFSETGISSVYYEGTEEQWYTQVKTNWRTDDLLMYFDWDMNAEPMSTPEPIISKKDIDEPIYENFALQIADVQIDERASKVDVPMYIVKNSIGFFCIISTVSYDPEVLAFVGASSENLEVSSREVESGLIKLVFFANGVSDFTEESCECAVLQFEIRGDAGSESALDVGFPTPSENKTVEERVVSTRGFSGLVKIVEAPPMPTKPSAPSQTDPNPTAVNPSVTNPSSIGEKGILGDANGDNAVNMKDVLLVRKYMAEIDCKINLVTADVNKDGTVNMKDALMLRKYLAEVIDTLEG